MKSKTLVIFGLVCSTCAIGQAFTPVSKNYTISSNLNKTYVDGKIEIPITETGHYLVILEADAIVPAANSGCSIYSYWNFGHVYAYNKTNNMDFSPAAGEYKWYMTSSGNNCIGGQTIPLKPSRTFLVYLQAGAKLGVRASSEKVGSATTLPNWQYNGKLIVTKQ